MMARIHEFPNLVPDDIDLSAYMEPDSKHRVREVAHYRDSVIRGLIGEDKEPGTPLPWNGLKDRFELRQHEMTIWSGYKGQGKSALISQVFNFAMCRNEPCFVISPEFTPVQLLLRMIFQRLKTRLPGGEELQEWFDWATKRLWIYDQQASVNANDVPALCRYVCEKFGVRHILIDSLMKCGIAPDDYGSQKRFVDQVQNVAHKNPVHIHLVAHARKGKDDLSMPGLHDIKGGSEIADMAENVVFVWRNKAKEIARSQNDMAKIEEPDAMIKVDAQRNAEGWLGSLPLWFDKETMLFYEAGNAPEKGESYVRF